MGLRQSVPAGRRIRLITCARLGVKGFRLLHPSQVRGGTQGPPNGSGAQGSRACPPSRGTEGRTNLPASRDGAPRGTGPGETQEDPQGPPCRATRAPDRGGFAHRDLRQNSGCNQS